MLCYTGRGCLTSKSNPQAGVLNNRLRYLDQTSALFSLAEQRAGNTTFAKTPLPLSRVRYQTTKPNRACFYIQDRTRLRGSEYLIWLVITQGGRTWQPFVGSENGNKNFRQARFYNFRVKCIVFARNRKFAIYTM